jgi:hypothetical protein
MKISSLFYGERVLGQPVHICKGRNKESKSEGDKKREKQRNVTLKAKRPKNKKQQILKRWVKYKSRVFS